MGKKKKEPPWGPCEPHLDFWCCSEMLGAVFFEKDAPTSWLNQEDFDFYVGEDGILRQTRDDEQVKECPYCGATVLTPEEEEEAK